MKFAIIAAGEGSRLSQEGVALPKPLVRLGGTAMIDRLLRAFARAGASGAAVIVNGKDPRVEKHLAGLRGQAGIPPLEVAVKATAGSMHSFHELSRYLEGGRFCLATVDAVFREEEFAAYVEAFRRSDADGYMAVTGYIDDEKPLYVSVDEALRITGFHDAPPPGCRYVSGGVYCLGPAALGTLRRCMREGVERMRDYQRQLAADGLKLTAYPFTKILDIDHAGDIAKAESFLAGKEE